MLQSNLSTAAVLLGYIFAIHQRCMNGVPPGSSAKLTSISAKTSPWATWPPSSTVYCSSFPAEGERSTVGSFSFSKSQVLLPMVIRYLKERERSHQLAAGQWGGWWGPSGEVPVNLLLHVGGVAVAIVGEQQPTIVQPVHIDLYVSVVHDDDVHCQGLAGNLRAATGENSQCNPPEMCPTAFPGAGGKDRG